MATQVKPNILQLAFGYEPSTPLAVVATIIFALSGAGLLFRIIQRWRFGDLRWAWCIIVGTFVYMAGFVLRPVVRNNPTSEGLFIAMQLFLITSPATFLAFNYIIYGRFVRNRVGEGYTPRFISPRKVALIFVTSDVTTFLIQGGGGGLQASSKPDTAQLGTRVVLVGLILQLISYMFFIFLVAYLHRRIVSSSPPHPIRQEPAFFVVWLVYFSSVFIMIRGIYRTIEFSQGHGGFLITHEIYFYLFDALPLFLATAIYVFFWPGKYVDEKVASDSYRLQSRERV
ncbi:RTA1-domain-containing protein [Schizopora paradoxa]|uniref:RTA1-domain-containing protein n=1 Tax=Schizopora paradoxa TaxID=27342 RepID=A0A0H2S813_9AGAM|nr:RTA1-domain-containing protein [Schizopora paradoxa]